VHQDIASQTGDKSEAEEVLQVFLPRPVQRATSDKTMKPNRKQKRSHKPCCDDAEGDHHQQQFSYSVEYFTWTLSDEEEEESDDCQSVTIPLNRLRISSSIPSKSSSTKSKKS